MLDVLNTEQLIHIKNLFAVNSRDCELFLSRLQTYKAYNRIGRQLRVRSCTPWLPQKHAVSQHWLHDKRTTLYSV